MALGDVVVTLYRYNAVHEMGRVVDVEWILDVREGEKSIGKGCPQTQDLTRSRDCWCARERRSHGGLQSERRPRVGSWCVGA